MSLQPDRARFLRAVSIFAETPDEILTEIGGLLEELSVPAGQLVVEKGQLGDCMYVVAEGRLMAHDGDLFLNDLVPYDVFGEMALLAAEPRMASITAVEPSRLLRIDQSSFYSRLAQRSEVMNGIIRWLCRLVRARVRDLAEEWQYIQQVARVTAAAAAAESGVYEPQSLDPVAQRDDELGQLARVFQRMMREVSAREERLKREVRELRIEINQTRVANQVAEITETDYFHALQRKVDELRLEFPSDP